MSLGEQGEELLVRHTWVGRGPQGGQLPEEDPKGPHVALGRVDVVAEALGGEPLDGDCMEDGLLSAYHDFNKEGIRCVIRMMMDSHLMLIETSVKYKCWHSYRQRVS